MKKIGKYGLVFLLLLTTTYTNAQVWEVLSQPDELIDKASQGNAEAMFQLAMCYRRGKGVVADQKECVFWLKRAAEMKHVQAYYYLASYYENGEGGLAVDSLMAYNYLTLAAEQKDLFSMMELGESFRTFKGIPNAQQACVKWLKAISDRDYVSEFPENGIEESAAEFYLYYLYQGNEGIVKDVPLSLSYLRKSVNHGNHSIGEALNAMGECYLNGNGVEKDIDEAIRWFQLSADKMCGLGSGNLGAIYYNKGMYNEAFPLLRDACENNAWPSPKAMRLLSACYKYGRGTSVNATLGDYWMKEAAKHNEPNAVELLKLGK